MADPCLPGCTAPPPPSSTICKGRSCLPRMPQCTTSPLAQQYCKGGVLPPGCAQHHHQPSQPIIARRALVLLGFHSANSPPPNQYCKCGGPCSQDAQAPASPNSIL
ncbi:hypothetical protein LSTR_LSTR008109 [Laodelphax striatellus]|uniref:Uncharacterized protein n=1 Tax=Laodelphax striatellus TaxID=195883 RepID=A0A482XCU5_LAOST|nr:hypothetical protein LSTR_LSTR008109 [Laodelphax striatellus]